MGEHQYAALAYIAEREAGLHMPPGKQSFVTSRLQRRLRSRRLDSFDAYLRLLRGSGPEGRAELDGFIEALTTNVTGVFREPHHFALLAEHLAGSRAAATGGRYRIWSAGCSTGEEPLSIAATCRAVLGANWHRTVEILATDVDGAVLEQARQQTASETLATELAALPPGVPAPAGRRAATGPRLLEALHAGIAWRQHNLLHDLGHPHPFDAIFCRNVTIYFAPAAQVAVHAALCARLAPGGLLAIGHSERLLAPATPMVPAGRTAYRRAPPAPTPAGWRAP